MGFYKSYGRPIAKVFLGAVFTYQAVYWLWVKLETDEIKERKKSKAFCIIGGRGYLADMVSQEKFRDWRHRFEMYRGSRHRELIPLGIICIWWLESCGCCYGDSRSMTVPVHSARVYKDWGYMSRVWEHARVCSGV